MTRKITPSDPAHMETDNIITKLEKKLTKTYKQAYKNASDKFTIYMAAFDRKDAAHRADVAAGKWTQEQYDSWRKNQLLYGDTLKGIQETIASDLQQVDKMAVQMIRDKQVDVYALNHNYGTYEAEHGAGVDTSYTLYDHDTVERLVKENPRLLPKPSAKRQKEIDAKDHKWNMEHLNSAFTASILSGDSIPKMAQRISSVAEMDRNAAFRNARTMCTAAENGGRTNAYTRAKGMGIDIKQQWVATLDGRTRDSHRMLDGEIIEVGEKFSNGLRFPADPEGPAGEVDNCRCCTAAVVNGVDPMAFDKTNVLQRKYGNKDLTYEQWREEHKRAQVLQAITTGSTGHKIAEGKDISDTWQRRPEQFDFEIEDVMDAQGFDGKPKIVSQEEFDRAVKEANDGNGFIAQRTYSAPDEETLQAYQDQLYDGKWYVDCSTGGAQYGQGMYCAADYTGTLTNGIKVEMDHYISQYNRIGTVKVSNEEWLKRAEQRLKAGGLYSEDALKWADAYHNKDHAKAKPLMEILDSDTRSKINEALLDVSDVYTPHKIETMTLDPSAKVIKFDELFDMYMGSAKAKKIKGVDKFDNIGSYAVALGYDAINAESHGKSESYTVILNRTKCIILDNRK